MTEKIDYIKQAKESLDNYVKPDGEQDYDYTIKYAQASALIAIAEELRELRKHAHDI
jgi:hypothetical protein